MILQVFQVGFDHCDPLFGNAGNDLALVVRRSLTFFDGNGSFGTMSQTCAQAVAEEVADQPGLAVNHLQGSLGTSGKAKTATVAFSLIYLDDLSSHVGSPI